MTKESKRGMKIPDLFCQPLSLILLISSSPKLLVLHFLRIASDLIYFFEVFKAHIPRRWFLVPLKSDSWTKFLWDQRRQESDFWSWSTSKIIMRREAERQKPRDQTWHWEKKNFAAEEKGQMIWPKERKTVLQKKKRNGLQTNDYKYCREKSS